MTQIPGFPVTNQTQDNPLKNYYRQPKIYVRLPSMGKFYNPGDLEFSETGEYPVFSMTAKDELMFKTPDALLNGQATVDVIQSCVPSIKNAWAMPSIDLDAILIAIRIATYGEMMELTTRVSELNDDRAFDADLRVLLDSLQACEFDDVVYVDSLTVHIKPLTYKEFTQSAIKTFEEQRIFQVVNNNEMSEEEKLVRFNKSFKALTELTVGMIISSIASIEVDGQVVADKKMIKEFVENADSNFYKKIKEHIEKQKEKFQIKPYKAQFSEEDIAQGAPETIEIPVTFDQSNFFG